MRVRRIAALLCGLVLLIAVLAPAAGAAQDDTVYVRKHVSLLYDNSGSMSMELDNAENLKWCYGSYAAQAFTGLLNDMDTLTLTFMNSMEQGRVVDSATSQLELDMTADRQAQVRQVLEATSWADGGTPVSSIYDALEVLIEQGLQSDEELAGEEVSEAEQYWLVLTTDGVFDTSAPGNSGENLPQETVEDILADILEQYSNLQLVYFGIGTKNDSSDFKAVDFGTSRRLTAYPNFTAEYADGQEQIVSTMRDLSNRISGRYAVTQGVQADGKTVTLQISGESSPIRNVALLAQNTAGSLLSARTADGTELQISRSARLEYPRNDGYDQLPENTLGGCTALITCEEGKIPAGKVVLTFSEEVDANNLSLMYEPAIYVALNIQRQDSEGQWVDIPYTGKLVAGDTLRVQYSICEDGSDEALDPQKLPGKTEAEITCDGEPIKIGEPFTMKEGNCVLAATVSMMDGAYRVSTSRTLRGNKSTDFSVSSSGSLTMGLSQLKDNQDQYIDFTVFLDGAPADADRLTEFQVESEDLKGQAQQLSEGVIRFTPQDPNGKSGTYTVTLTRDGKTMATETVTVEPNPVTYTAEAGDALVLYHIQLKDNAESVPFYVTAHTDDGDRPITDEEASAFRIEAVSAAGERLEGAVSYRENGELHFTPTDADGVVGEYTVTLYRGDEKLAAGSISVLQYNADFMVSAVLPADTTVDRLDLFNNETSVHFIIYADKVPCTQEQLADMLSAGLIQVGRDPEKSLMRLEVTLSECGGVPAVEVRPTSRAKSAFGAFWEKTAIAWGAVPNGELTLTLGVQTEKGAQASGVLTVDDNFIVRLIYMLLFLVILLVVLLIVMIIYSNFRMLRIKPGTIRFYKLRKVKGEYIAEGGKHEPVYTGLFFYPWPVSQTMEVASVRFTAKTVSGQINRRFSLIRQVSPNAVLSGSNAELASFRTADASAETEEFLEKLKNGYNSKISFDAREVNGMLNDSPLVELDGDADQIRGKGILSRRSGIGGFFQSIMEKMQGKTAAKGTVSTRMKQNSFLARKSDTRLEIWTFEEKRSSQKKKRTYVKVSGRK